MKLLGAFLWLTTCFFVAYTQFCATRLEMVESNSGY